MAFESPNGASDRDSTHHIRSLYVLKMHPPPFHRDDLLSDWPECRLEIQCGCGRSSFMPVGLIRARHGDRAFGRVLKALRCEGCGARPAPVYLLAGHARASCWGGPPGWALELVPVPRESYTPNPSRGD